MTRNYEGRKSVRVTARQSGESHFMIAAILKNKNKVSEVVKQSASSKAMELKKKKIQEGPLSDVEKFLMAWTKDQTWTHIPHSHRDHGQSKRLVFDVERKVQTQL